MNTKKLTELSLMTSLALIIFIVELRLPNLSPIPGVKLGLANIITVYCMYHFTAKETAMMIFSRILLGSIFSGNISAMLYSISGALLCFFGMIVLKKFISEKYIWLCSIIGAVLHNTGQIIMAMLIMRSFYVIAYFPVLIVSGCIAGMFTGITAQTILNKSFFNVKCSKKSCNFYKPTNYKD